MKSFSIIFSSPWFLLFLIPLAALTFIPYFRISKKFRRNRNRLIPLILHLTVVTLSVFVLSGMTFNYTVPNLKNEIILLVDVSESEGLSAEKRDEFIETVLRQSRYDSYHVGIVTFGFDQTYAVPLTDKTDEIFDLYQAAEQPDKSATNIADALLYTKDLFNNPASAKIVLVTDAKETDKEAASVIRAVTASGIKVDVANISSGYENNEVEIVGVDLPDYHVKVNEEFNMVVNVFANTTGSATIALTDNGNPVSDATASVQFVKGLNSFTVKYKFPAGGMRQLGFTLQSAESTLAENDQYCSYYYLQVFNKILMIGRSDAECTPLKELLTDEGSFDVEVKDITKDEFFDSTTVDALREYDQVILNNIANDDLPDGFATVLTDYVQNYGGGVFTVGGSDGAGKAHSYVREDMYGSVYQQLLPVQAIDYTPPKGVIILIDRSGSMGNPPDSLGKTPLDRAKEGAEACLSAMSERDYVGIITLDSFEEVVLPLTPRTMEKEIREAINSFEGATGGTVFSGAIRKAGNMLRAETNVDKRHIIIVTDGLPGDAKEDYELIARNNYENETASITMSVVIIGNPTKEAKENMEYLATEIGHGKCYNVEPKDIERIMREDLKVPEIKDYNPETFNPIVNDPTSPIFNGVAYGGTEGGMKMNCTLDGFYGVKLKKGAELILAGEYNVPVYAQWKFGKGYVGSFMCDLSGEWSSNFMSDDGGKKFICNVVENLMPVEDIRPKEIDAVLKEQNYINRVDVYTDLKDGEYVRGRVEYLSDDAATAISMDKTEFDDKGDPLNSDAYVFTPFGEANGYTRCDFVLKTQGNYRIVIEKCNANGDVIATKEIYKSFSYSEEFDLSANTDSEVIEKNVKLWAERGRGKVIEDLDDPQEIFSSFETTLKKTFDPRTLFMIIAIVLFLSDVAIRKFKFKWPHEIIKEYRDGKNEKNTVK